MNRLISGIGRLPRGVLGMPWYWQLWLLVLVAANLIAPVFLRTHLEARVTLAVMALAALVMFALAGLQGFTRLLGLGHFPWFLLVAWLFSRLPLHPTDGPLGIWLRCLIAVNAISLVIDLADVVRWLRGERSETVVTR